MVGDIRFAALLDSRVAKCSHAKGRSSSKALMPSLRKGAALQICGGLYPSFGFAPTRLNTADDPTRDAELRRSCELSCIGGLDSQTKQRLHSLQFSRPTAGWIRLCLLLGCLPASDASPISTGFWNVPSLCGFCSYLSLIDSSLVASFWTCSLLLVVLLELLSLVTVSFACFLPIVLNLMTPKTPKV